jgi:hypothetical protein
MKDMTFMKAAIQPITLMSLMTIMVIKPTDQPPPTKLTISISSPAATTVVA